MAQRTRYNGNLAPFASAALATERTVFGSVTQSDDINDQITLAFLRGWGIVGANDLPTLQDFNAMGYTLGYLVSYLYQQGVAEWNDEQDYYVNNIVAVNGDLYKAIDDSTGEDPTDVGSTFWSRVVPPVILNNTTATTAPTTGDDSADGYSFGSIWYNTSTGIVYVCVNDSVGAAVWKRTSIDVGTSGAVVGQLNTKNTWSAPQLPNPVAVAYAATVTLNLNSGQLFQLAALTGNMTLALPSNIASNIGSSFVVEIPQDATGGRVITYNAGFKFPKGIKTPLSTAANAMDKLYCIVRSSTVIDCYLAQAMG